MTQNKLKEKIIASFRKIMSSDSLISKGDLDQSQTSNDFWDDFNDVSHVSLDLEISLPSILN